MECKCGHEPGAHDDEPAGCWYCSCEAFSAKPDPAAEAALKKLQAKIAEDIARRDVAAIAALPALTFDYVRDAEGEIIGVKCREVTRGVG